MFNSAARLSRAATGAARQAILAKSESTPVPICSVNSIAEKPMHSATLIQSFTCATAAPSTLMHLGQPSIASAKKFQDLVNHRARAIAPVLPPKPSNKNQLQPEIDFKAEIENVNMQITGLKELVKAWKKDLDCARNLHSRKAREAINIKIRKAQEEEKSLIKKLNIIELTSEIAELEKQLETLRADSAQALKMKKLATTEKLFKKINELETDLVLLTDMKARLISDNSFQAITISTPKTIAKKSFPTKQLLEPKAAPSKIKEDFVTFSKEFTLLDKVSHALNVELSLALKHLSVEKLPYCKKLIVRAQNQLSQIEKFKINQKQLKFNHTSYLNILIIKRKEDITLLREKIKITEKKEQPLKTEILSLKADLEKTINAIDKQVKYLENIDLEECILNDVDLEELEMQQKSAELLYTAISLKEKQLKEIQEAPTTTNQTEAQVIKSTEINRKIKEKFANSIEKLGNQSKLKQITEDQEIDEETKEIETIKRQAINIEITKLKAELTKVMNEIEVHYMTLKHTDLKESNLANIDTTKIEKLLKLAEYLDDQISIKSKELE